MRTTANETEVGRKVAGAWGAPFVLGLLLTLLGIVALVFSATTAIASILAVAAMLLVAGVLEVVYAFRFRKSSNRFGFELLSGILAVVVGLLLVARPLVGLAAASLLLAGYFVAAGLFRGITAVMDRYSGWGWDIFYAVVAFLLGVIVFAGWPLSAFWVVGTLIGAVIITRGIAIMAASLWLRREIRGAHAANVT